MKVLMVISQFYPIIGGAEKQAQLLAEKLIEKGLKVKVVTGWWSFKARRKEIISGIEVFRNFSCWRMFGIRGIRTLGGLIYMISLGIYLLVHRREYDIIHVHQVLYPAFVSVLIGKGILHKPVIVKNACTGDMGDIKQIRRFPLGNLQLKYLLKKMECLIVVSNEGSDEFKAVGYTEGQITYVPNGVVPPSEGKVQYTKVQRVLTMARLDRQKGIDVLLEAWATVVQHEKSLRLRILGDGLLKSELKRLSETLEVDSTVEFIGTVRNVGEYLKDSDIFVLPSRAEGLSNSLLEAMSYGLPCITTNIGGNAELLKQDGNRKISPGEYVIAKNGLLVNPDDAKGLAEAILYLIQNGEAREEIGRKGCKFIRENFSIDLVADKYIALYKRMLKGRS
mgnify:CR=1 FL=1